jgi:tetratricopeptide (TPR) repeat protein
MRPPPSSARRSALGRAAAPFRVLFVSWPRFAYRWFRGAPRWMQAILLLTFIGAIGGGGYYAVTTRMETLKQRKVRSAWIRFEAAARAGDEAAMRAALDEVRAADPTDSRADRWQKVLDSGEGDPGDQDTVLASILRLLRAGRLEEAVREADKRLTYEPKDWLARCVRAMAALSRGDRAEANAELDQLPSPEDRRAHVSSSGLLLAFRLYRAVGRDVAPLRAFVQSHVLPHLRSTDSQRFPAGQKAELVDCYLEAFEPATEKRQPPAVAQGWAAAARLADLAVEEATEAGDTATLTRIGRSGTPLAIRLRLLRRHDQVTAEQFTDLNRELEDRTRRAWQAVRDADPTSAEAYRGLAESHWRAGDADGRRAAWEVISDGLKATNGDPQLYEIFSQILKRLGAAEAAWEELRRAAELRPGETVLWVLAADAALAAHRPDLARQACEQVRAVDPNNRWATWMEARIWLNGGYPHKAVDLLRTFGEPALARDPSAARAYARALTETEQETRVEGFLALAEQAAEKANSPGPAVAVLVGWGEARPDDPDLARKIAGRADRLLARWADEPDLYRVRAGALFRAAEGTDPPWDPARVREAIQSAERLRARLPNDTDAAFWLGWLRLADDNPERALRDVAPLLSPEADPVLTAPQLELIGAVYRRTGRLEDAVRVLSRAGEESNPHAGVFIQLALTYHERGQYGDARAALEKARHRPRTPREQADYRAAVPVVYR